MITDLGILKRGTTYTNVVLTEKPILHVSGSCGCTEISISSKGFYFTIKVPNVKKSKQVNITCRYDDQTTEIFTYNFTIE
jgi:hypothetical protein